VSPETATFSKAAAADVVLTVAGATTITALKNGTSNVNAANYTINGLVVTITKDYLTGLANGDKTFTVVTDAGSVVSTVTVGD